MTGRNAIGTALQHLIRYKPLLRELVVRDLKVKYRRSFLGYLWSLLNPLLMMAIMTVIFSYMFRFDIPNYPLYLICGQTLWNCFNEATNMAMTSVIQNGSLIKKVYIPKFIFPISRVLSSFVTMLFSLAAILVVMICTGTVFHWEVLLFWIPLILMFLFSCGAALILSAIAVQFRDIMHLYSVITMAWMYGTPIFYPVDKVPTAVQIVIKLNPIYHYINFFRELVLYGMIPGPNTWFACIASSFLILVIGLAVFRKLQRNFILYI
ncbi:ABC transporter permease [Caproiciproducens sp. R1]|uniref:ABC transporter permease n=1 Tax=Caproiciproducens sp. R1 TaxID=3435000 RepID=UPI0040333EA1